MRAGAISYGALACHYPEDGGEYLYIPRIYHPTLGILSGLISILIGFSAPLALAAMAFEAYLIPYLSELNLPRSLISTTVVVASGLVHSRSIRLGARIQNLSVSIKICGLFGLILLGIWWLPDFSSIPENEHSKELINISSFGMAVVWISFSYSGFNAAIYVVNDVKDPKRSLPRALIIGTLLVVLLYLLFNTVLLYTLPIDRIKGQINMRVWSPIL